MSKRISIVLTSALLTAGLMLGACGAPANSSGAQSSSAAETTSTQSTTAPAKVDVSKAIVGDWKAAQYEVNGVIMTGDLSAVMGDTFTLSFTSDGKGTFGFAGESVAYSWKAKDDTTVTLTFEQTEDNDVTIDSLDVTYYPELNAVSLVMEDESTSGTVTFTADGTLGDQLAVDLSKAKTVTSVDQVAGTWKLTAAGTSGIFMSGDSSALAEAMGGSFDTTFVIEADGKFTGGIAEYTGKINVSDKGATIEESGVTLATLKLYNESLIMDMSEAAAVQAFTVYSK